MNNINYYTAIYWNDSNVMAHYFTLTDEDIQDRLKNDPDRYAIEYVKKTIPKNSLLTLISKYDHKLQPGETANGRIIFENGFRVHK